MLSARAELWEDEAPHGCQIILQDYEFPEEKAWERPILGILPPQDIPAHSQVLYNEEKVGKPPGLGQNHLDFARGHHARGLTPSRDGARREWPDPARFHGDSWPRGDGTRCPLKCER